MTTDEMILRLYNDSSLIRFLHPAQAEQVLSWAEGGLQECTSEIEFRRFCDELRLLNRYVAQGGRFDHIFAMLRKGTLREPSSHLPSTGEGYRPAWGLLY